MTTLKDAVAYARYSSDRQNARSIDDQFELCRKIAKQNGYRIVAYFEDAAIAGSGTLARAGWLALMRAVAAKDRAFDAVIVESLSRMSRDLADSARDFKRITYRQVALIDLEGPVNTMRVGMSGIMNQEFRKHLGNMMRRAWDGRIKDGLMPGKPAYGHRKVLGTSFEREVDPEAAVVVNRIFAEYANGEPTRDIAARLNRDGIPSPSGGKWNHQVFIAGGGSGKGMIGNRSYIGEIVWNNQRSVINPENEKRNKQKGNPDDLLSVEVPHLRIIDQSLWDRAQALRAERGRPSHQPRVYKKTIIDHLIADKLVCAECGGRMKIVGSKAGEDRRVGCTNARHKGVCTNTKSYNLTEIEATVLHGCKHHLDVEALTQLTEGAYEGYAARQKTASAEREIVESALNRSKERIDRIATAIADTDVELPPLMEKLKALTLEKAGLVAKLDLIKAEGNVITLHPATVQKFRTDLETMIDALTNTKLTDAQAAPFRIAFGNIFEAVKVHTTGKRRPVEVTPLMRIAAIMGTNFMPKLQTSKEVLEEQGVTNLLLATQGTLSSQKHNIINLGRWRPAA